jgi:hypothetical protein
VPAARDERPDARDELARHRGERLAHAADVRGLRHVVGGTRRERVERRGRTALRERREHDDRDARARGAQRPHRVDAVHHGHLDVHGDEVGCELLDLRERDLTVRGRADHVDRRIPGERVGDEPADHDGVVDHQDPDT